MNRMMPSPSWFVVVLEAMLAVWGLRVDRGAGLNSVLSGQLGAPAEAILNDRQLAPDVVPEVVVASDWSVVEAATSEW